MQLNAPLLKPPLAAAWVYMSDDQDYRTIPKLWSAIDFAKVDLLFVAPTGLQADGTFGLYNSKETGPIEHRFKWVVRTAREQNPHIKIIVSQFWGSAPTIWGYDLSVLKDKGNAEMEKYVSTLKQFMKNWLDFHGGIDGYDIDYEVGNHDDGNVYPFIPDLIGRIRHKFDELSNEHDGRKFYITVSPAETTYLEKAVPSISYANMQTYAGGSYLEPKDFLDIGFDSSQLLYGICPEVNCSTKTVEEVEEEYEKHKLAGIHLWRLNSVNYDHEIDVQKQIYEYLHP